MQLKTPSLKGLFSTDADYNKDSEKVKKHFSTHSRKPNPCITKWRCRVWPCNALFL